MTNPNLQVGGTELKDFKGFSHEPKNLIINKLAAKAKYCCRFSPQPEGWG
jgi:hypothetical protein